MLGQSVTITLNFFSKAVVILEVRLWSELEDVRDLVLLHLPFKDAPQMLNKV